MLLPDGGDAGDIPNVTPFSCKGSTLNEFYCRYELKRESVNEGRGVLSA